MTQPVAVTGRTVAHAPVRKCQLRSDKTIVENGRRLSGKCVALRFKWSLSDTIPIMSCPVCGERLPPVASRPGRKAQYCSPACRQRAYRQRHEVTPVLSNLVPRLDTFVGRVSERVALAKLVRSQRLVTVTGSPGAGKTRLAVEVAGTMTFPGGVWFVDLAAVPDPDQVDQAVRTAVRAEHGDSAARDTLAAHLADQRVLLVLDNCEHVVERCADLVTWLLPRCPDVRVLATSREALRVNSEHVYTLGPLPVSSDAVHLFADRATAVDHEFRLTPEVEELCRRLDGLPLAIELAARRVRHLPTAGLAELLRTGERTASRHRSLDTAITWSYELLEPREQEVLRQLSVLAGKFSAELASVVCGADVLDQLVSLAAKSLVVVEDSKYRLLEAIRIFGVARLREQDELDAAFARLLAWYVRLWEPQAVRFYPDIGVVRLVTEHVNTVGAVTDWAARSGDRHAALLTWGLVMVWARLGHFTEAKALALRALDRRPPTEYTPLLLSAIAGIETLSGRAEEAVRMFRRTLELEQQLGRQARQARALAGIGNAMERMGDIDNAWYIWSESLVLLRQVDEPAAVANTLHNLAGLALRRGDLATAEVNLVEARDLRAEHELPTFTTAAMWHTFGELEIARGDHDAAEPHFVRSLRIAPELPYQVMFGLVGLAEVAAGRGDDERALRLVEGATAIQCGIGSSDHAWQQQVDSLVARTTAALGPRCAQTARSAGRRMSITQAVHYALDGVREADSPLSLRQLDICRSVAKGQTDRQIARALGVSTRTVNTYLEEIRTLLGLRSRAELAAWITRHDNP